MARSRYIDQLSRSEGNGLIMVFTGLRRSGKSFLLKKLFRQHLLDDGVTAGHIIVIDMENRAFKSRITCWNMVGEEPVYYRQAVREVKRL